ncbi:MAG: HEAT repeat domain-containing protein, partial [Chthoniobacteraceae bacterium]
HQIELEPNGAGFKLKDRQDFVKGVLTTDVEFGNDGSLYVLDWVESWGGVGKGRIYKFTDPGADAKLQEETKRLIEEGMKQRPEAELEGLLAHADMRVRMAAQFQLAERGEKGVPALTKAAQSGPNRLARLHGLWGLGQVARNKADVLAPVVAILDDGDAEVRAQAAKVLGEGKFKAAGDKLVEKLKDGEARVRYFAALSVGKLDHKPAFEPLCQLLAENKDHDPVLRHGAVMGLAAVASAEQLTSKVGDGSPAVRAGAVLALRKQGSAEIAMFLGDKDASTVLEAARAIHDVPIADAMPALAKLIENKDLKVNHIISRAINANYRLGKPENAQALAEYASAGEASETGRKDALDALANWENPGAKDRVLNAWRPIAPRGPQDAAAAITPKLDTLLKDDKAGVQEMVAKVAARLSIKDAGAHLFALASNDKASTGARVAAIQALAALKDSHLPQVAKLAVSDKDSKVRAEGLQALAGADPGAAVKVIGEIVITGAPSEKQGALLALTQINRPEAHALIGTLMDKLIEGSVPAEIRLDVYEAARRADKPELKEKIERYEANLPKDDPLAPYRIALAGGDVERGRKIFREKAEVQCLRCHKAEIGDSQVGPDLTHIGASKDRAYLLESIVYPNRTIAQGFDMVIITQKDDQIIAGKLIKEDAANVEVETMDEQGKPKPVTVPVAQIKDRVRAPSPMTETIRDFLSKSELRDLVEYLATRK